MPSSPDLALSEDSTIGRPSDEEALRLVLAFYCILEPEKRAEIIKLAEDLAKKSAVVEGCTHFHLLERDIFADD